MESLAEKERLPREIIAMRVAKELPDGAYVNLGIGIPTLVSSFLPEGRTVFYHSESGILNCGPLAEEGKEDIDLINAGGQFLDPAPGMSFFDSAQAFAMIRGGHVDVTVLGSHQVSANGDLANWMLPQRGVGNVGGAMDLGCRSQRRHRRYGAHRPRQQPQNRRGMHLPGHRARLRLPDSDRPGRNRAHPRRPGPERGGPRLDFRGSAGPDWSQADSGGRREGI